MQFVERWQHWLSRSEPVLKLHLRNLYIVPSGFGGLWLLTTGVLYVVGINSRSNGPVLLGLLLLAVMLLALFLTHLNLQGLELQCLESSPSCADEPALVHLLAISQVARPAIQLRWLPRPQRGAPPQRQQLVHLQPGRTPLQLPWTPPGRGRQLPGRLLIHTTAPLGLFRCWGYWEPPLQLAIGPARRPGPIQEISRPFQQNHTGQLHSPGGSDDFHELTPLRPQDGLQRVAWKTVARGQGWFGKRFETPQPSALWLAPARGIPYELALEHLCERLWRGLQQGESLGLVLASGVEIAPGSGQRHWHRCLQALAPVPTEAPP